MEKIQALKGTYDILPSESYKWQYLKKIIDETAASFGFSEITVPVFEYTNVFARGVGDTTDVVQKEMYTFKDKGNRSITLRPEGTSGVVRSVLEHSMLSEALPIKLYYMLSCYRNEKPQAGRYREFRQFGVEAFGSPGPEIDAEIISLAVCFIEKLGLKNVTVNINSIGCPNCRKKYNEALKDFLRDKPLCETCRTRFDKNPLRILDCKEQSCKEQVKDAPILLDYICDECKEHFESLKKNLELLGITYKVDPGIVRGLDYYTKTVFEIKSGDLGAQSTICGGGRYDGLVEQLGGKPTPGIGFGLGLERLLLAMEAQNAEIPQKPDPDLFICHIGEEAGNYAMKLTYELRKKGINVSCDLMHRGLKAQMKYANKLSAKYTVVLGDTEINSGKAMLKNMCSGEDTETDLNELADKVKG